MEVDKKESIKFINIIKKKLKECESKVIKLTIEKKESDNKIVYEIGFKRNTMNISGINITEKIDELINNLMNACKMEEQYPEIKLDGNIEDFLEQPNSLLFELFGMISNEEEREKIYQTLYGNVSIFDSINETTRNFQNNPEVANKILKCIFKKETKSEDKHIGVLYTIIDTLIDIRPTKEYIHVMYFKEEFMNLIMSYKKMIIQEDSNNKTNSSYHNIRDKIYLYIKKCDVDKATWEQYRQFFPVGKNNGHLNEPTEKDFFINPQYNFHHIILANGTLFSYYENMATYVKVKSMMETIINILKVKDHKFLKAIKLSLFYDEANKDEQHIIVKINKNDNNNEKTVSDLKKIIVGLMNTYQDCMDMEDKDKKNYLNKAADVLLLGLQLNVHDIPKKTEIKRNKI